MQNVDRVRDFHQQALSLRFPPWLSLTEPPTALFVSMTNDSSSSCGWSYEVLCVFLVRERGKKLSDVLTRRNRRILTFYEKKKKKGI